MGRIFLSPVAYRLVRWSLAAAFLVAGLLKLGRPELFAVTVEAFGIVPDPLVNPLAVGLPALEVLAAAALLFDVRGSLGVVSGLLGVFIAVLLHALRMGLDIDCGCYGPGEARGEAFGSIRTSLHRDLLLLAGVLYLYAWRHIRRPVLLRPWGRLLKTDTQRQSRQTPHPQRSEECAR